MREYNVRVVWQNQGKGYERTQSVDVRARSVRAAVNSAMRIVKSEALATVGTPRRGTWREKTGGYFKVGVIVGPCVPTTNPDKNQDLTSEVN